MPSTRLKENLGDLHSVVEYFRFAIDDGDEIVLLNGFCYTNESYVTFEH